MIQVALFKNTDPVRFKNDINEFIKDKHIVDIKYNTLQSMRGTIMDAALIMYKVVDKEKNDEK